MEYPNTIYESDSTWGDQTFVLPGDRERVEESLSEVFDQSPLSGEWTEWTRVSILGDGTAVYGRLWATPADGKTRQHSHYYQVKLNADNSIDVIDGSPSDKWTTSEEDE